MWPRIQSCDYKRTLYLSMCPRRSQCSKMFSRLSVFSSEPSIWLFFFLIFLNSLQDFVLSLLISLCEICGQCYTEILLESSWYFRRCSRNSRKGFTVGFNWWSQRGCLVVIWIANHLAIATHVYCFYFIIVLVCFLFIALYSVCNSKSFGLTFSLDSFVYGSNTDTYMDMFPC